MSVWGRAVVSFFWTVVCGLTAAEWIKKLKKKLYNENKININKMKIYSGPFKQNVFFTKEQQSVFF